MIARRRPLGRSHRSKSAVQPANRRPSWRKLQSVASSSSSCHARSLPVVASHWRSPPPSSTDHKPSGPNVRDCTSASARNEVSPKTRCTRQTPGENWVERAAEGRDVALIAVFPDSVGQRWVTSRGPLCPDLKFYNSFSWCAEKSVIKFQGGLH